MRSTPTRLPDRVKAALWASSLAGLAAGAMMAVVSLSSSALAENIHGAATDPTTAPGFSHPEQYIHLKDVKPADNMYPVIQHPEQDKAAQGCRWTMCWASWWTNLPRSASSTTR
jgi:hypothetical protein